MTLGKERVRYYINDVRCTQEQYERAKKAIEAPPIEPINVYMACQIEECGRDWDALRKTALDGVRWCTHCKRNVHYCKSDAETKVLADLGMCVAVPMGRMVTLGIPIIKPPKE